jgi:hypothetical protein
MQDVIRRVNLYLMLLDHISNLKEGHSHFDTQSLGFLRSGNHATVVITQHHNWLPV